jgi:RNA polymerase sigma-70 factor (ECF subfamily)
MRHLPDRATLLALHDRLLRGDRLASDELSRLVLPALAAETARRFPRVDEHVISDGVSDAVLDYCAAPQRFDTAQNVPLHRFLATAAWRNVVNLVVSEQRRKARERHVGRKKCETDVALDPAARNIQQEEQRQAEQKREALFAALKTPQDRDILALWLDGVKDTAEFARVLNITHLPFAQQQVEVYRNKERIIRFLRRRGLLP